jgi:hypothetical protein
MNEECVKFRNASQTECADKKDLTNVRYVLFSLHRTWNASLPHQKGRTTLAGNWVRLRMAKQ